MDDRAASPGIAQHSRLAPTVQPHSGNLRLLMGMCQLTAQSRKNGEWKMENGEWKMESYLRVRVDLDVLTIDTRSRISSWASEHKES